MCRGNNVSNDGRDTKYTERNDRILLVQVERRFPVALGRAIRE